MYTTRTVSPCIISYDSNTHNTDAPGLTWSSLAHQPWSRILFVSVLRNEVRMVSLMFGLNWLIVQSWYIVQSPSSETHDEGGQRRGMLEWKEIMLPRSHQWRVKTT